MVEKKDRLKNIEDNFRELHRKIDVFVRDVQIPLKEQLKDKGKKTSETANKPVGANADTGNSGRNNNPFAKGSQFMVTLGNISTALNKIIANNSVNYTGGGMLSVPTPAMFGQFSSNFNQQFKVEKKKGQSKDLHKMLENVSLGIAPGIEKGMVGAELNKEKRDFERKINEIIGVKTYYERYANSDVDAHGRKLSSNAKEIYSIASQIEELNVEIEKEKRMIETGRDEKGKYIKQERRENLRNEIAEKRIEIDRKKAKIEKLGGEYSENGGLSIGKGAKETVAKEIMDNLKVAVEQSLDIFLAWKEMALNIFLENEKSRREILSAQIQKVGGVINKSMSSVLKGISNGNMTEQAYGSAGNMIENVKQQQAYELKKQESKLHLQNYAKQQKMEATSKTIGSSMAIASAIGGIIGSFIPGLGNAVGAGVGTAVGAAIGLIGGAIKKIYDVRMAIVQKEMQLNQEELRTTNEWKEKILDTVAEGAKQILDFAKNIEKVQGETDKVGHTLGTSFGLAEKQMDELVGSMYTASIEAAKFGKKAEDILKIQNGFNDTTERNMVLSTTDQGKIFGLGRAFGIGDEQAAQMVGSLNIFNKSVESGSDMMFEMYKTANKMGVSNKKFAKDLANNLKLAQKYNFKGGVKGMMDMSLWSQKTRFNIQSLSGMLDKLRTGNIEDTFRMAGELNVLGGNAAAMSDPLGMLADAWGDPAAYAKRVTDMTKGLGRFNRKTGETEFGIGESMRIKRIAEATGQSEEDIRAQIMERKKREEIKRATGDKFTEDQLTSLGSKAQYNYKTSQWEVTMFGGKKKDINSLTADDFEHLMPNDKITEVTEYAKGTLDVLTQMEAIMLSESTTLSNETKGNFYKSINERIANQESFFHGAAGKLAENVEKGQDFATFSMESENNQMLETINSGLYDNYMLYMKENAKNVGKQAKDNAERMKLMIKGLKGDEKALMALDIIASTELGIKSILGKVIGQEYEGTREGAAKKNKEAKLVTKDEMVKRVSDALNVPGFVANYMVKYGHVYYRENDKNDSDNYTIYKVKSSGRSKYKGGVMNADSSDYSDVKDGIGLNGGNVVSVNDGFGRLNRPITRLGNGNTMVGHPDDNVIMAKPDGPISKAVNAALGLRPLRDYNSGRIVSRTYGGSNNIKIDNQINGTLTLKTTDGQKVDLMKLVNDNSGAFRDMVNKAIDDSGRKLWKVIKDENNFYDNNGRPSGYVYR